MELGKPLIVLEFRLDLEEYLETVRAKESRSRKLTRIILMTLGSMLVAILLGVPFVIRDVPGIVAAFLLGVLPLAVLMVILPWYYKPDRFFRSYYRKFVFNNCRYEFAEEGIRVSSDSAESKFLWKAFTNYVDTETQLVLTCGMVQYILPKRAIEPGKLQQLTELIGNKIPPRVR